MVAFAQIRDGCSEIVHIDKAAIVNYHLPQSEKCNLVTDFSIEWRRADD